MGAVLMLDGQHSRIKAARPVVPSFGNWDMGAEVPYTTVFEKVRAMKDSKPAQSDEPVIYGYDFMHSQRNRPTIQPQTENKFQKVGHMVKEQHSMKRYVQEEADPWRNAADIHNRSNSTSSRRSSLEQIADHIFTESHYAAGSESPVVSRRSMSSNNSLQSRQYIGHRDEHFVRHEWGKQGSKASSYQGYPGRGSRNSGGSSPKSDRGARVHQQLQKRSGNEMKPNRVLPKFGDWDANTPASELEFTVIFDKARDEKKAKAVQDSYMQKHGAVHKVEEDLYKPSFSGKKSSGLWSLLCCRNTSVQS